jgi:hypothetical protein
MLRNVDQADIPGLEAISSAEKYMLDTSIDMRLERVLSVAHI